MFHISLTKLTEEQCYFYPRIPALRSPVEDETIPRICVSGTIKGCTDAIIHCHIQEALRMCRHRNDEQLYLYVYTPKEKVESEHVLTPEEIQARKYVPDVHRTNELWLMKPTVMTLHSVLHVTNVKESFDYLHYADFGFEGFPFQLEYEQVID